MSAGSTGAAAARPVVVDFCLSSELADAIAEAIAASIAANFSSRLISSLMIALAFMFVDPLFSYFFARTVVLMFNYYTPHMVAVYPKLGVKIPTIFARFTTVNIA